MKKTKANINRDRNIIEKWIQKLIYEECIDDSKAYIDKTPSGFKYPYGDDYVIVDALGMVFDSDGVLLTDEYDADTYSKAEVEVILWTLLAGTQLEKYIGGVI